MSPEENTSDIGREIEKAKFLTDADVREVASRFGTPVFVYDESSLREKASYLAALPNAFGLTVRYSIKACPSQAIIRIFDAMGLSFDASSVWEVKRARRAGVRPAKILLTAQEAKFNKDLQHLLDGGVEFDAGSLTQLEHYGQFAPHDAVSVRVNPGFGSGLVTRVTSGGPTSSFGIWHENLPEVKAILEKYKLRLVRLHTHIGSGHRSEVLLQTARWLLEVAKDFPDVRALDLGGGYRTKTLSTDPVYDHRGWTESLAEDMRTFAEETGRELHLELEPGTYLTANAGSIVARVIDTTSTGPDGYDFLKIDSGLSEIVRPSYYGTQHPLVSVPAEGPARQGVHMYCVAGHCCIAGDVLTANSSEDKLLKPLPLPPTRVGDYLIIERGGGYTSSMSMKNFNSYPEATEILRRTDGSFELIRQQQTLDQMIQNESVPTDLRESA